jgi:tetratricopeptide (TPR) repeat protein
MGFLDYLKFRFLSEKPNANNRANFVELFDANGQSVLIHKDQYKKDALPSILNKAWDNPDSLYKIILGSLDDGFHDACIEPAKRLLEIDPNRERSHTVYGIVLNKNEKYQEAEAFFNRYLAERGESAAILCNLAKSYAQQNKNDLADNALWRSLELDPNISNSVGWYAAIAKERDGDSGYIAALEKISKIPTSWHADLWLARHSLEAGNVDAALERYKKLLLVSNNASEALFMASGDLGKSGYAQKMVELIYPLYNLQQHGYKPAMNLMQAFVELKDAENGFRLLSELKNLNRPDLIKHLHHFESSLRPA